MNYRSALLRLWLVGSVCWIGYWIWHYTTTCNLNKMGGGMAITCRWESAELGGVAVVGQTAPALMVLWDMASITIGVPGCLGVAGIVVCWVIERFRSRTV